MKQHHRIINGVCGIAAAIVLFAATGAHAEFAAGGRAGFSTGPDQFVVGGQAQLGSVMPMIHLVPSIDFGFSNNVTITTFNVDLQYNLPSLPKVSPNLYVGAGPTIVRINPDGGKSDTKLGFSLLAGLRIPMTGISYYNLEARFGSKHVPDTKVLLGIMFGL